MNENTIAAKLEKLKTLEAEANNYNIAIRDASDALDSTEREIVEVLEALAAEED